MKKGDRVHIHEDKAEEMGMTPDNVYTVSLTMVKDNKEYVCFVEENREGLRFWYPADYFEKEVITQ